MARPLVGRGMEMAWNRIGVAPEDGVQVGGNANVEAKTTIKKKAIIGKAANKFVLIHGNLETGIREILGPIENRQMAEELALSMPKPWNYLIFPLLYTGE